MNRLVGLAGAITLTLATECSTFGGRAAETRLVNHPAPDFQLASLEGHRVRLGDFRGRPVVLAFFAVGCGPCRAEAPHLSTLVDRYEKDGLVVLALNAWDEDEQTVKAFAANNKLRQQILVEAGEVAREFYGVDGLPMTFWIDRGGVIVDSMMGFDDSSALDRRTRKLIERTN